MMNAILRALTPEPRSLLAWMEWLYTRSAQESTLSGPLGVWPEELGPYLRGLCLAYTPLGGEPARITLAPGLITPSPAHHAKRLRQRPGTCLLLLSGGKDSLAAGALAMDAGYVVYATHVRRINPSYPGEDARAEAIAERMGWPFQLLTPARLARTRGQSVIKNTYALTFALEAFVALHGWLPELVSLGNFWVDDCHTTSWYSDMEPGLRAFTQSAIPAAYGDVAPIWRTWLRDERHSVSVWATSSRIDAQTRALNASCMTPQYNKPMHRRRNLEAGVPLLDYDCGSCGKCYARALLLADAVGYGPGDQSYPTAYLDRARSRLAEALRESLWCHAHPDLECGPEARAALGIGPDEGIPAIPDSATYLVVRTYGGALGPKVTPRRNDLAAVEPVIVRW